MRAALFGSSGLVGRHLVVELQRRGVLVGTELTDSPTHVFNTVGFTDIDGAERNSDAAFKANEHFAEEVANFALQAQAILVHVSTEFVFDGNSSSQRFNEEDEPCPVSVYAKSKRAGELRVIEQSQHYHIIRLQNLYGVGGKNLLSKIATGAFDGGPLDAERLIVPMWAGTAAKLVCEIADGEQFGIWHVTARDATTYAGFAAALGVKHTPVSSAELKLKVARPSITLDCQRAVAAGVVLPTWQESYAKYLVAPRRKT